MTVLHYSEFGDPDGEPVLAIHGVTAHGRRFRRLAEEGWPERRTVAVDLRGHGDSTYDGPWSIPQHVTDLIDTLDHVRIDAADIVSHSYGGAIALALLERAPARVRRLVLLDPALAQPGDEASEAALRQWEPDGWATVEEAATVRKGDLSDDIDRIGEMLAEEMDAHLEQGVDGRYRFRFHKPAVVTAWGEMSYPIPETLPSVPTLLVGADRAPFVTPDTIAALRRIFGNHLDTAHIDCGHMLYWERFDETATMVAGFLMR